MLVTPLRDGMNLVAKEYVACRTRRGRGAGPVRVHRRLARAAPGLRLQPARHRRPQADDHARHRTPPTPERRRRMRAMRRRVADHDVQRWAERFLEALASAPQDRTAPRSEQKDDDAQRQRPCRGHGAPGQRRGPTWPPSPCPPDALPPDLPSAVDAFCRLPAVLVATDFDGVLAPLVTDPMDGPAARGRPIEDARGRCRALPGTSRRRGLRPRRGHARAGSPAWPATARSPGSAATAPRAATPRPTQEDALAPEQARACSSGSPPTCTRSVAPTPESRLELKPTAAVLHTRGEDPALAEAATRSALRGGRAAYRRARCCRASTSSRWPS